MSGSFFIDERLEDGIPWYCDGRRTGGEYEDRLRHVSRKSRHRSDNGLYEAEPRDRDISGENEDRVPRDIEKIEYRSRRG